MGLIEVIYVIILGIIEGITEWLPISSTGHLILFEYIFPNIFTSSFSELFNVVIQLGAIMAVVCLYFKEIVPIKFKDDPYTVKDKYIFGFASKGITLPEYSVLFSEKSFFIFRRKNIFLFAEFAFYLYLSLFF